MSPIISMIDLPTQLLIEILSRLPVESILVCKCVCKLWLDLLSNADFTKLYHSTAPTTLLLQPIDRYNQCKPMNINTRAPCLFHLQDYTNLNADSILNFKLGVNLPNLGLRFLCSCDGLLCLYDPEANDPVYICNPISRELITLPKSSIPTPEDYFDEFKYQFDRKFGLGFSSRMSKQYKVIRVVEEECRGGSHQSYHVVTYTGEIYTLGEGAWRSLEDVPNIPWEAKNIFLNGTLHWDSCEGKHFISFDFDTEQFGTIDGPPIDKTIMYKRSLGVLQGCLSLCNFEDPAPEIWVMKDYGVKESWTKEYVVEVTSDFILKNTYCGEGEWYDCDLVTILESGEILILFNLSHFVAYDLKLQCFRLLEPFPDEDTSFEAFPYRPNLVSLKDVAAGENIEVCTG